MNDLDQTFVFDEWKKLAENDPEAFELKRKRAVQKLINKTSGDLRRRLEGVQWKVDVARRTCSTPSQSCSRIFSMMWESVYGDNGLVKVLDMDAEAVRKLKNPKKQKTATILSFA